MAAMAAAGGESKDGGGRQLAAVQFAFAIGWTAYALMLPALLARAGIAASWLPLILIVDQAIFAAMDIAFGALADRMRDAFARLARLLLVLTTLSAVAFVGLPAAAGVAPELLLAVLLVWVVSASVVRAPTFVLLAKRAKAAQRPGLVVWYAAGSGLALALSPFLGLWLRGVDPLLPFAGSALVLLAAVVVLLRRAGRQAPPAEAEASQPAPFVACLPLFGVLAVAGFGFQVHAFANAAPLYQRLAAGDSLPWLMPLLWVGFFAALVAVGPLVKRFAALPVASAGLLVAAAASFLAASANGLPALAAWQLLSGAGWALAFAGLMEQASAAAARGAEGKVMGTFFAVTALASLARIAFVAHALPDWASGRYVLPGLLLLLAAAIAAVDGKKWAKIKRR